MATFIHICTQADLKHIRRAGIRAGKHRKGVYAMPATPDFFVGHQWMRELRRWRAVPLVAVYLRVPDSTAVMFGHYNGPHTVGTANEAVAALMHGDLQYGFEAIILRDITPGELLRAKPLRPITGWRYFPTAKGRRPCGCPMCQARGEPFSRRFKERFRAEQG